MDNTTPLKRWLAVVRLVTGTVFVCMGTNHLLGGVATANGFLKMIGGFSKADPLTPYTNIMVPIVLSAPGFFGPLFVFGMLAAGLGLVFGFLTPVALVGAVWLSLNNLLMGFSAGGVHHSLNTLMLSIEIGFLWTGAWRQYSLDSIVFARGAVAGWQRVLAGQRGWRRWLPAYAQLMLTGTTCCRVSGCARAAGYRFVADAHEDGLRCRRHALTYWPVCGRAIRVALIIGTILMIINQADVLLSGHVTALVVAKIGLTYLVPFSVSTYSALAANRLHGQ